MMLRRSLNVSQHCSWLLQQHPDLPGTREGRVLPSPLGAPHWPVPVNSSNSDLKSTLAFPVCTDFGVHFTAFLHVVLMCFYTWRRQEEALESINSSKSCCRLLTDYCHMCTNLRVVAFLLWRFCKSLCTEAGSSYSERWKPRLQIPAAWSSSGDTGSSVCSFLWGKCIRNTQKMGLASLPDNGGFNLRTFQNKCLTWQSRSCEVKKCSQVSLGGMCSASC